MRSRQLRERTRAALTGGGISILLGRALIIGTGRARQVLRRWVCDLAIAELALDVGTLAASIRWWRSASHRHCELPLRLAAAATILHSVRVLVFVLGRFKPFKDFDVQPGHEREHDDAWTWGQVWFAAIMSTLGLIGVGVVRRLLRDTQP